MPVDAVLDVLADRVRDARARGSALAIRGGGTKAWYGEAAQGEPLDTTLLTGISSYEPTELVVTVRAGTRMAELEVVGSSRVDLQACKLEYSIVSPK